VQFNATSPQLAAQTSREYLANIESIPSEVLDCCCASVRERSLHAQMHILTHVRTHSFT
jgi:hypothetical protein